MNRYSAKSKRELSTTTPNLQRVFTRVLKKYDHSILEGRRGRIRQNRLFNAGSTKVMWPNGKHNQSPSKAIDAAPYPIDWGEDGRTARRRKAINRFYHFAGYVFGVADELCVPLRWGGDWDGDKDFMDQTFDDLVHFEELD